MCMDNNDFFCSFSCSVRGPLFSILFLLIYGGLGLGLSFWGWGFQLIGLLACVAGPSGFSWVGLSI